MMLRNLTVTAALLALTAGCRSIDSSTFDAEAVLSSAHVFRGLPLNDGYGVETRGRVDLNRGDGSKLFVEADGYLDVMGDPGDAALEGASDARYSRIDLLAGWRRKLGDWGLAVGVQSYNFPNVVTASTTEVYLHADYEKPWYRPGVQLALDVQNGDDVYARAGFHPRHEFDRALIGDLGLDLGYMGGGIASFWYGRDASGLSDLLLSGGLTYVRDENLRVFLRVGYASVLLSELKDQNSLNGFDDTTAWGQLGLGWSY